MCNLYSVTLPPAAMRSLFDVPPERDHLGNQPSLPAVFPRHDAPVLRITGDGERELVRMHWGFLLPQVSKRTGAPILPRAINNTRDDALLGSRFWRDSFEARRCLVPASSFCEAKGRRPATYYWFALRGAEPRPPFAFAGIWRRFRGRYRDGALVEIDTFSIVTTTPNPVVGAVHPDRMPALLAPGDFAAWLSAAPAEALRLIRPYPAEAMAVVLKGQDAKQDPGYGSLQAHPVQPALWPDLP